jgi:hypothetical protein
LQISRRPMVAGFAPHQQAEPGVLAQHRCGRWGSQSRKVRRMQAGGLTRCGRPGPPTGRVWQTPWKGIRGRRGTRCAGRGSPALSPWLHRDRVLRHCDGRSGWVCRYGGQLPRTDGPHWLVRHRAIAPRVRSARCHTRLADGPGSNCPLGDVLRPRRTGSAELVI